MEIDTEPALNPMLRGAAIALLALLAFALLRSHPRAAAGRLGAAFALGTAAATLADTPGFGPTGWRLPLAALAAANMLVFWLFTRALLDDAFAWRRWHAAAWVALAALGVTTCLLAAPPRSPLAAPLGIALTGSTIGFALLAIAQAAAAWREDLVERRRRVRVVVVASAGAYALLVALAALAPGASAAQVFGSVANALGLAALSFAVASQLLTLRDDGLIAAPASLAAVAPTAVATEPAEPESDPRLVAQLDRLMAVERAYREPSLSIGALAQRIGLPEHKLRRLINQGLGYRNFSAFLNGYRIADAKAALADPTRADVPILTIAMAAGFQSIGPFNRAFKESLGATPSEYRRGRAAGAAVTPRLAETESG